MLKNKFKSFTGVFLIMVLALGPMLPAYAVQDEVDKEWIFDAATGYLTVYEDIECKDIPDDIKSQIKTVDIKEGVTNIDKYVFEGCTGLTSVIIPESVTSIGICAFRSCTALKEIELPTGLESINNGVFSNCSDLTSVTIPEGVTSIGICAFVACTGLTSVTIPAGVNFIGKYAFRGCESLTSVTIPDSVIHIGNGAFYCCGLKEITVPNGAELAIDAFDDKVKLTRR